MKKNILVIVPKNYEKVGGLRIPINKYISNLQNQFEINILPVNYKIIFFLFYKSKTNRLINENTHSIIVFSGINQAIITMFNIQNLKYKCKTIFYIADSPLLLYESMLILCKKDLNLILYIGFQIRRILSYFKESYVLNKFDDIIYLSKVDYNFVIKKYHKVNKSKIHCISHATEIPKSIISRQSLTSNKFFMIGILTNISHYSYILTLKPLIENIFPKIYEKNKNIKLVIVGKNNSNFYLNKIIRKPFVEYKDYVTNLSEFYESIDASIYTVRKLNGILNRILESWAYNKLVFGYDYNFSAFTDAVEDIHFISSNSDDLLSNEIIKTSLNRDKIKQIENSSYELVKKHYNWDNQFVKFNEILSKEKR